jgi:hypothetical protein
MTTLNAQVSTVLHGSDGERAKTRCFGLVAQCAHIRPLRRLVFGLRYIASMP